MAGRVRPRPKNDVPVLPKVQMRLLSLLTLLTIFMSTTGNGKLDESTNFVTQILGAFQGKNSVNITQFLSSFDIPTCLRRCIPPMDNIHSMFNYDNTDSKAMNSFCAKMMNSTKCATSAGCSDVFMDAMTNAFQFICIDNLEKVSDQFTCIQEASPDLQQECENECSVQASMIEKASKNNADELFSMENMCNSTTCLVQCYRTRLEHHCRFGENNILDNIFKQVLNGEKNGLETIMGWMMPNDCKDQNLKLKIPKKISLDSTSKPAENVGRPAVPVPAIAIVNSKLEEASNDKEIDSMFANFTDGSANSTNLYSETTVLIDGKPQTIQFQLLDSQKNPVETPNAESLSHLFVSKKPGKEDERRQDNSTSTEKKKGTTTKSISNRNLHLVAILPILIVPIIF